jgi:hypothetical protein
MEKLSNDEDGATLLEWISTRVEEIEERRDVSVHSLCVNYKLTKRVSQNSKILDDYLNDIKAE